MSSRLRSIGSVFGDVVGMGDELGLRIPTHRKCGQVITLLKTSNNTLLVKHILLVH